MSKSLRGFTLIELMIVVAIIGILAAIAMPQYRSFIIRSWNQACLAEARAYMSQATANLANGNSAPAFIINSCQAISTIPTRNDYDHDNTITFTVHARGDTDTQCNASSATCKLQ